MSCAGLLQEIGAAGHDDYLGAFLGEALRGCFAYAVAAAGDYGHLVLEAQVHGLTPGEFALTATHYNNRPHSFTLRDLRDLTVWA